MKSLFTAYVLIQFPETSQVGNKDKKQTGFNFCFLGKCKMKNPQLEMIKKKKKVKTLPKDHFKLCNV